MCCVCVNPCISGCTVFWDAHFDVFVSYGLPGKFVTTAVEADEDLNLKKGQNFELNCE